MSNVTLPAHIVREIAVRSRRDPRTVLHVLNGRSKPVVEASVHDAMRELGIAIPVNAEKEHRRD